jgi:hypothetical protein
MYTEWFAIARWFLIHMISKTFHNILSMRTLMHALPTFSVLLVLFCDFIFLIYICISLHLVTCNMLPSPFIIYIPLALHAPMLCMKCPSTANLFVLYIASAGSPLLTPTPLCSYLTTPLSSLHITLTCLPFHRLTIGPPLHLYLMLNCTQLYYYAQ